VWCTISSRAIPNATESSDLASAFLDERERLVEANLRGR
jgi:hypothetical protein